MSFQHPCGVLRFKCKHAVRTEIRTVCSTHTPLILPWSIGLALPWRQPDGPGMFLLLDSFYTQYRSKVARLLNHFDSHQTIVCPSSAPCSFRETVLLIGTQASQERQLLDYGGPIVKGHCGANCTAKLEKSLSDKRV